MTGHILLYSEKRGFRDGTLRTPRLTLCISLLPQQTPEVGPPPSTRASHQCQFSNPLLMTALINALTSLPALIFFPIITYNIPKHLNYMYVPLLFGCNFRVKLLKVLYFPAQLE